MQLAPFKLEEFWKKYEFTAPYLLCPSDTESWQLSEILDLADLQAKKLWDNLNLAYTEPSGLPVLREALADLYASINSNQIITFTGAEEGIYCTLRTLLSSRDHVIVIAPCYQSLQSLPQAIGADVSTVNLTYENQWKLEIDAIREAIRSNTKMILINYPHNPTGTLLSKENYEALIRLAREYNLYIFSDEVYRYLEIDEQQRLPSVADTYERGIALNVMSKAFGLAGLRVGWIACPEVSVIEEIGSYKLYTTICNSAHAEILALMALRAKDYILTRNRAILLKNIELLDRFFERQSHRVAWVRPQCGTVAYPKLLLPMAIEAFVERSVSEAGVLIMPESVFETQGNFFRIGFGRKNMPEVLQRFEAFLNS
jgi:aspartate/methionine/tyrosine aminotransferase